MRTVLVLVCVSLLAMSVASHCAQACVGARALAMGGAFTGLADDVSATYWNPAALPDLDVERGAATWMHTDDLNYQDYVGSAVKTGSAGALGLSWLRFRLGLGSGIVDEQNWYWVSAATRVGPRTSLGANVRFINDSVSVPGASGDTDTALDVALYHHASGDVTLGLLVQNANKPETTTYIPGLGSGSMRWIRNWRPGVAVRLPDHVIVSAEVYNAADEGNLTREQGGRALRFGVEKKFPPPASDATKPGFALRAGWYGNLDAVTLGAGVFGRSCSVDAALLTGDFDNTWVLSASANW